MTRTSLLLYYAVLSVAVLFGCRADIENMPDQSGSSGDVSEQGREAADVMIDTADGPFDCELVEEIPAGECQALVAFFAATDGASWKRDGAPWEEGDSAWLESATPCSWIGITCMAGHVDMISLGYNGLRGRLPAEMGGLPALRVLDLHNNEISGEIPASVGQLANLESVDLSANRLEGPIPAVLGALDKLATLVLSENELSGSIPGELGELVSLRNMDLSGNQLSGELPATLAELENLETLRLSNNLLAGVIPAGLGELPVLAEVDLAYNELTGPVPSGLDLGVRQKLWGNWLEGAIAMNAGETIVVRGAQFAADPALGVSVWPEEIAASEPQAGAAWWDVLSPHIRLTFAQERGNADHAPMGINVPGEAQVHIYPVAMLDASAQEQVAVLQRLLGGKRAADDEPMPLLPLTNAREVFHAQVVAVDFQNGRGIRYLTQNAQGPVPAANDQIFYTFQGLSSDGAAYVAAFFPVGTPILPATAVEAMALPETAAFVASGDPAYIATTRQALNGLAAEAFEPALNRIDALINSLSVSTPDLLAPTATLPGRWPDDGEAVDGEPVLQWEAYPEAAAYELVVVDDDAYPPVVAFSHTGPDTVVAVAPMLAPGSYSWTVRATDGAGHTLAELNRQFLVKALLEGPSYPPAGEAVDAEPILQWQPVAGASSYEIVVVDDGAYPPSVAFEGTTVDAHIQIAPALPEGRHYTWTVRGQDGNGRTVAEMNSDFTVYTRLTVVEPADGAEVGAGPVLRWEPVAGAAGYDVVVVTGYPPETVFEVSVAEPTVTVSPELGGVDVHYWTVWAKDSNGRVIAALASSFSVVR